VGGGKGKLGEGGDSRLGEGRGLQSKISRGLEKSPYTGGNCGKSTGRGYRVPFKTAQASTTAMKEKEEKKKGKRSSKDHS